MLDSTSQDFSNPYWTKLLVSPLPTNPDISHAYLALRIEDNFHRVEVKFPSSLRDRNFVEDVQNETGATQGLERFILFPFNLGVNPPALIRELYCEDTAKSVLNYAKHELPKMIPSNAKYCGQCRDDSFNSNTIIGKILEECPQLGELPPSAVGLDFR